MVRDNGDVSGHVLHSKEGVTQGDTLDMIAYGIGVLPVIRELRVSHPRVTKPSYADDAGAGRKFVHILVHLWDIQARVPERGYYPEPTKIILVVALWNVAQAEEFFQGMAIQVVTGHRYLGGVYSR